MLSTALSHPTTPARNWGEGARIKQAKNGEGKTDNAWQSVSCAVVHCAISVSVRLTDRMAVRITRDQGGSIQLQLQLKEI
ncbi:hypothetical protein [Paraburkholderia sp. EG304]|uniref:hypothetical protein n=1 Tax=Paraburkholderia sp. EG304 TaxID=3237015 RepID=UPI00397C3ADA